MISANGGARSAVTTTRGARRSTTAYRHDRIIAMRHAIAAGTFGLLGVVAAVGCSSDPAGDQGVLTADGGAPANDAGSDGSPISGNDAGGAPDASDASKLGDAAADAALDPCAKSFFCDDFEAYAAGNAPGGKWGKNQSGGTVTVDTARAHSGRNAVKASAGASSGYRSVMISLSDASLLPVTGNHLFGRMMFFLESSPATNVHWTFVDGSGPTSQGYDAIYRYGGQTPLKDGNGNFIGNQLMANYDTPSSYQNPPVGPSSDCWLHATTEVVPVGAWSCAEWEFDGPNDTMRFWLNGTAIADLTMSGTGQGCVHQPATFKWLAPQFKRIDVGWESYQADAARTMWIDDVALGTQRLGCAP
jgi:hypothetical protein